MYKEQLKKIIKSNKWRWIEAYRKEFCFVVVVFFELLFPGNISWLDIWEIQACDKGMCVAYLSSK